MPVVGEGGERTGNKTKWLALTVLVILVPLLGIGALPFVHPGAYRLGDTGVYLGAERVAPGEEGGDGPGQFPQGWFHDAAFGSERWALRFGSVVYWVVRGPRGS